MLYLDTSVLVAALTPEPGTATVQQWLARQPPEELHISDWVTTEFSSALSIKLREGQIGPEDRASALAMFTTLTEDSLSVLPVNPANFHTAARFADQAGIGLRAGDALHLAVASAHGAAICTLDQRLHQAAPAVAVNARRPDQPA